MNLAAFFFLQKLILHPKSPSIKITIIQNIEMIVEVYPMEKITDSVEAPKIDVAQVSLAEKESWFESYFKKMVGGEKVSHRTNFADAFTGGFGSFIAIITLLFLTNATGTTWLMASFGASCVLVFGAWNAPFSQPLNIIGGNFISGVIGISMYMLLGSSMLSISLAVSLTIITMMLTRTVHPPAGGNPIIIILGGYGWSYLWAPILIGSIIIVILAVLINNIRQNRKYPLFWI